MNSTVVTTTTVGNATIMEEPVPRDWILAAQAWAWTVSCVGGVGNLVTISSISHQLYLERVWRRHYHNDRHGFRRGGRPVVLLGGDTLLLLHLSVCDFLYCVVNLPLTALTYDFALGRVSKEPSKSFCTGAALFRYINALAEWTTLGLLTVERCVDLGRSRSARFFRPRPTVYFIAAIWIGSLLLQLGAATQGRFSYERTSYKCDMTWPAARIYFYTLESLLPSGLMLTGCISIIAQISRNTKKLRASGASTELVAQRFRMMVRSTALVLALLLLFLLCVIPICVYNVEVMTAGYRNVPLGISIFMIYWTQYGVNFLVYAASNANYRKAYKKFFELLAESGRQTLKARHQDDGHSPPRNPNLPSVMIETHTLTSVTVFADQSPEGHFSYEKRTYKCDMTEPSARVYFYSLQSLVPCGLMLTGCCSIILQVRRHTSKLLAAGMPEGLVSVRCRSMVRSTALLLALLLLFLASVIPVCVYNIETLVKDEVDVPINIAIYMIYWVQYGVNFLVYAAINHKYRTAYHQLLSFLWAKALACFRKRRKNPPYKPEICHLMLTVSHLHTATSVALPTYSTPGCEASQCPLLLLLLRGRPCRRNPHHTISKGGQRPCYTSTWSETSLSSWGSVEVVGAAVGCHIGASMAS